MKFKFEELRVYQESINFVTLIFSTTKKWPAPYKFSLADQLQRAALSICLNIAEGSGRTSKDFQHFLSVSRGSCYECIAVITVAKQEKLLTDTVHEMLYSKLFVMAKMLSALKSSIG